MEAVVVTLKISNDRLQELLTFLLRDLKLTSAQIKPLLMAALYVIETAELKQLSGCIPNEQISGSLDIPGIHRLALAHPGTLAGRQEDLASAP